MSCLEEDAAVVWWGNYIPIEDAAAELLSEDTPEALLMQKEADSDLSKDMKALLKLITEIPEELYRKNGTIPKHILRKFAKKYFGWSQTQLDLAVSKVPRQNS